MRPKKMVKAIKARLESVQTTNPPTNEKIKVKILKIAYAKLIEAKLFDELTAPANPYTIRKYQELTN
jgi:hypothetical protein